jgi:hypothetical protein
MWLKVDDNLPDHPKFIEAGRRLGRSGLGRALGVWLEATCYCTRQLTDGFLPNPIAESLRADAKPLEVLSVLTAVGLFHNVPGGFQVHDFEDWNPEAAGVKTKRAKDAKRKRDDRAARRGDQPILQGLMLVPSWRAVQSDIHADAAAPSERTSLYMSAGRPSGQTADVQAPVHAQSEARPPRSRARDPVPSRPVDRDQDPAARAAVRAARFAEIPPDRAVRALAALARSILRENPALYLGALGYAELAGELKARAARAKIPYDGDSASKALRAAEAQFRKAKTG